MSSQIEQKIGAQEYTDFLTDQFGEDAVLPDNNQVSTTLNPDNTEVNNTVDANTIMPFSQNEEFSQKRKRNEDVQNRFGKWAPTALTLAAGIYAMTKAGLVSVTKSFANEYGKQGIRVNAILPGVIDTRFAKALVENPSIQKWLSKIPAGRVGQPNDMVAGVLYLVSDDAAYTTGTTLVMDGGACIR